VTNLVKKVAHNVATTLDYYIFLQLEASKSNPIDKKIAQSGHPATKLKSFMSLTPGGFPSKFLM
jgi:hypothetical protein